MDKPKKQQTKELQTKQGTTLIKFDPKEIDELGKPILLINNIREFKLSVPDILDWAKMIKASIPDVNPLEIEEAIIDIIKGKHTYEINEGVRTLVKAIKLNRGENWYYRHD